MTEADVIQPSASIASTGLGIRYIGDRCYAFSGPVASPNSATADSTLFEFTTLSGIIVCEIQFVDEAVGTDARILQFKLNNLVVLLNKYDGAPYPNSQQPYIFVLPPETKFQFNFSIDGSTADGYATLTGRVYGAA